MDRTRKQSLTAPKPPRGPGWTRALVLRLWPFWHFRDASRGDLWGRAAAYRHNRGLRTRLPAYLRRWSLGALLLLQLCFAFNFCSRHVSGLNALFLWMAAGSGMAFACALCLLLTTAYVYLYLGLHDF
jgi:hypothetical protein